MACDGVGPGVPAPQQHGCGLTGAFGAVVDERAQWVEAESEFECRCRPFPFQCAHRAGWRPGRDQRVFGVKAMVRGTVTGTRPHPRTGGGPRCGNGGQHFRRVSPASVVISRDTVGSDATEPTTPGWLRSIVKPDTRSAPRGDRDRQIQHGLARSMRCEGLALRRQRRRQASGQPGSFRGLHQQHHPRLRDQARTIPVRLTCGYS